MTLFNDLYNRPFLTILSEAKTDGSIMKILVPFCQVDEKNANGRIYTKDIMEREINRVSKDIADGKFLGSADHPKSGNTELNSVSHLVKKMWLEKDGRGWASLSILDTTAGKNLKTIVKAGGKLGVSTRGFGTFSKETSEVNDDYELAGLDIVANPSFKAGVFSQDSVFESIDLNLSEKKRVNTGSSGAYMKEGIVRKKLLEELKEDTPFARIVKMLFEGEKDFDGTLEEYADLNGLKIKAVLAVENGDYPDYEMAMLKIIGGDQAGAEGKKMDRTPTRPAEPRDYYEESKITGIHPVKRAKEVNEERAKPAATEKRIALYRQVWVSFGQSATKEKVNEAVDRIMAANIRTEKPVPKVLSEAEKKRQKRISIAQGMHHDGALAGFKREQIDCAIAKKMAEMDEIEKEA